jgi:hypothetical protein
LDAATLTIVFDFFPLIAAQLILFPDVLSFGCQLLAAKIKVMWQVV